MNAVEAAKPKEFLGHPFGLIYLPNWSLEEDPLKLVSRAEAAER